MPARPPTRPVRTIPLAALALGVLALAVYANGLGAGLIFDSRSIVTLDPRIQTWNPDTLSLIFTQSYWWPEHTSDLYRPLTTLTYWVNYTLLGGGVDVTGYHLVNLVVHWINAVLVFAIVSRLARRRDVAFLAAALFAVHPVNTEAVTNVVGRADLLATLSVLGAGWCYLRACEAVGRARILWLASAGAIAFVGVLAKETAIVIGAFVVLYDLIWRRPWARGTAYLAFLPAAVLFVTVRIAMRSEAGLLGEAFVTNPIAGADWFTGFMTAWHVIGRYVALLVWPGTLSADYSYDQIPLYGADAGAVVNATAWASLLGTVLLIWLAIRAVKSHTVATWGVLFFFAAIFPTSNLLVRIGTIMGERFLYLPSIGFCTAAAYTMVVAHARATRTMAPATARRLAAAGVAVVLVALGTRTWVRNADWRDDLTFWRATLRAAPASFNSHAGYAGALMSRDQQESTIDSAIVHATRSLAILESAPLPPERKDNGVLLNLGIYYRLKGQRAAARGDTGTHAAFLARSAESLVRAREIDEAFNKATQEARLARGDAPEAIADAGNYTLYLELGNTYLELRDWSAARGAAIYAQRLMPDAAQAHLIEGVAHFYERHPDSAAVAIAAALLLDGRQREHWGNLASAFQAMNLAAPLVETDGRPAFDLQNPLTTQLLARSAVRVVQRFVDARRLDDAERWRMRLMREYAVRAEVFAGINRSS